MKSASLSQLPHIPYGGDLSDLPIPNDQSLIQKIIFCLRILQVLSGQCCEKIVLFFIALLHANKDKKFIYFMLKFLLAYLYRLNIFCYILLPGTLGSNHKLICWIYTGTGGLFGVASAWLKIGGMVGISVIGPLSLLLFGGRTIGQCLGYWIPPTFDESDPQSWNKLIEDLMRPSEDDPEIWHERLEGIRSGSRAPLKNLNLPPRNKIEAMIAERLNAAIKHQQGVWHGIRS